MVLSHEAFFLAQINKPSAGAQSVKELPVGAHPLQLYSMGTPNGQKVTVALEEMGLKYDAWYISIFDVSDKWREHIPSTSVCTVVYFEVYN